MSLTLFRIKRFFKTIFFKYKKKKIKAVYDSDLIGLLTSFELVENVKNGEFRCVKCNDIITIENIGALYKKDKELYFICSKPVCTTKLY